MKNNVLDGRINYSDAEVAKNESSKFDIKIITMYFPQLHVIPENDNWWGKGFTDWENVRSGTPQYPDHYQPRVPLNENYYDQSEIKVLRHQIELARKYKVFGFCHYHYWFDGKQLLETPTNLILANKDIDFPFCLSWANETWSRRWDGRDHQVLIKQTHPPSPESWQKHYNYLIKAWSDPRAIKVDGKPVFVIYRPQNIEKINEMLDFWSALAQKDGLPGIYFIFQKTYDLPNRDCLDSFDGVFQFQPFEAVHSPTPNQKSMQYSHWIKLFRRLPERHQDLLRGLKTRFGKELTFHDYNEIWRRIIDIRPDDKLTTFPGAFVDWDNAARYKNKATIFRQATPEAFGTWLKKLVETMTQRNLPENFIFLNAWNEWAEGAYLEPDEKFGYQYLEAVRDALTASVLGDENNVAVSIVSNRTRQ